MSKKKRRGPDYIKAGKESLVDPVLNSRAVKAGKKLVREGTAELAKGLKKGLGLR